MMKTSRGFTLVEVMIAVGISSILAVATMSLIAWGMESQNTTKMHAEMSADLLLMHDYFARVIPNGGGQSLGLWSSFWAENNCAAPDVFPDCNGSDRLSIINATTELSCRVVSWTTVGINTVFTLDASGGCCLNTVPLNNSQVLMTNNGSFSQRYASLANPAACTVVLEPGPMAGHDFNATPPTADWTNALITPVAVSTYYLNSATNEFFVANYRNNGTGATDKEVLAMADQVLDFQISLGFDMNPTDGELLDSQDNTDEWLYNVAGESFGAGLFTENTRSTFKAITIGLIMAARGKGRPAGKLILDGPERKPGPEWIHQSTQTIYHLRNTSTFQ